MIYEVQFTAHVQYSNYSEPTELPDSVNVQASDIQDAIDRVRKHVQARDWGFTDEDKNNEQVTGELQAISFDEIKVVFKGDLI